MESIEKGRLKRKEEIKSLMELKKSLIEEQKNKKLHNIFLRRQSVKLNSIKNLK